MSRTENMIVVIQCAGGKQKDAGHMKDAGRRVLFVADPESAPQSESVIYKRPDDAASSGRSCRDMLEDYNRNRRADNPLDLFPAWEPRVAPRAVRRGFPARAANCAPATRRTGTAPRRS